MITNAAFDSFLSSTFALTTIITITITPNYYLVL